MIKHWAFKNYKSVSYFLPRKPNWFRSNVHNHHFYLLEIDIHVQNNQGLLGGLFPSILDMRLACWGFMAILDLYIYFRQVKMMMKNVSSSNLALPQRVLKLPVYLPETCRKPLRPVSTGFRRFLEVSRGFWRFPNHWTN